MENRTIETAIITGPTGAISVALCEHLLQKGCTVYAICRPGSPRAAAIPSHERLHLIMCDLADLKTLPEYLPNVYADVFFHLGWICTLGSMRDDMDGQIRNIQYTIDAVRAAAAFGCRVFIGAGSQAEYGRVNGPLRPDTPVNPENGYGMAKLCAGQMSRIEAHKLGMAHIWPRILSVYGPHEGKNTMLSSVISQMIERSSPALTAGEQLWDYLYAADAAEALYLMARHGVDGAVYPLGSGDARPLHSFLAVLRDVVNPDAELRLGQLPYAEKQVMYLQADLTALQRDTGFVPRTDFNTGIKKLAEWIKQGRP